MNKERPISLCMIVRDEEDWVGQCIQSVLPIVSEVIVVDTGSTDKSIEIAKSLGAKIFLFPWEDDFANARNFSIEKATGDWIFILDADECIAEQDLERVYECTRDRTVCTEFSQRHYTNDHRLSEFTLCKAEFPQLEKDYVGFFESNCVRLFPNHDGLYYQGRVHELVEHSIYALKKHKIIQTSARIHHYGHTDQVKEKKKKGALYSPLGEVKVKEEPKNWKAFYELGIENNVNGRYKESVEAFQKSLKLNSEYIQTWVNCGYAHMELGEFQDSLRCYNEAIKRDALCSEAYCNAGVVGMRTGNLKLAEEASLRALKINPSYINVLCNLGRTYVLGNRFAEATTIFLHTLRILPQCTAAKADLGAVYLQAGIFAQSEKYLQEALLEDPQAVKTIFNIGQLYRVQGRMHEAKEKFATYIELERKSGNAEIPQDILDFLQEKSHSKASIA